MHDWHQVLTSPDPGSPAGCALALAIWVPLATLVWRAANGLSRFLTFPRPTRESTLRFGPIKGPAVSGYHATPSITHASARVSSRILVWVSQVAPHPPGGCTSVDRHSNHRRTCAESNAQAV